MKLGIFRALLTALVFVAPLVAAQSAVDEAVSAKIRTTLESNDMGLTVDSIAGSEIPGLYAVKFANGPLVYATAGGDYFILGDLYTVGPKGFVNLAEKRRDGDRAKKLAAQDPADMIIFPAQGDARATITVFTDVTCHYCQKLHQEVPELNKRGVTVRYMAYPRAGIGSSAYRQMVTAWCSDNPQDAITRMKKKEKFPENLCDTNPVAAQYQLGGQLGVRGTPAIVTESGRMIPGYQTTDELMATLGLK